MALDLFICGPGFGETIVMRWEESGQRRGAVVDGYAGPRGLPLISWLRDLGIESLAFLVATHPHLDHIANLHWVLNHFGGKVGPVWWWGGLAAKTYIAYFQRLAAEFPQSHNRLGARARAVELLLKTRRKLLQTHGGPALEEVLSVEPIYPLGPAEANLMSVSSFSPWDEPLLRFTRVVSQGINPDGTVQDNHAEANLVSVGLVVRHGDSQVVLGGDVEEENWKAFRQSGKFGDLQPCVVKVSHHGSSNGTIGGMWTSGGFFGSRKPPFAVITPYRGVLPDNQVVQNIRHAGCRVFITGQPIPGQKVRPWKSFVHFRVHEGGNAELADRAANVLELGPL